MLYLQLLPKEILLYLCSFLDDTAITNLNLVTSLPNYPLKTERARYYLTSNKPMQLIQAGDESFYSLHRCLYFAFTFDCDIDYFWHLFLFPETNFRILARTIFAAYNQYQFTILRNLFNILQGQARAKLCDYVMSSLWKCHLQLNTAQLVHLVRLTKLPLWSSVKTFGFYANLRHWIVNNSENKLILSSILFTLFYNLDTIQFMFIYEKDYLDIYRVSWMTGIGAPVFIDPQRLRQKMFLCHSFKHDLAKMAILEKWIEPPKSQPRTIRRRSPYWDQIFKQFFFNLPWIPISIVLRMSGLTPVYTSQYDRLITEKVYSWLGYR